MSTPKAVSIFFVSKTNFSPIDNRFSDSASIISFEDTKIYLTNADQIKTNIGHPTLVEYLTAVKIKVTINNVNDKYLSLTFATPQGAESCFRRFIAVITANMRSSRLNTVATVIPQSKLTASKSLQGQPQSHGDVVSKYSISLNKIVASSSYPQVVFKTEVYELDSIDVDTMKTILQKAPKALQNLAPVAKTIYELSRILDVGILGNDFAEQQQIRQQRCQFICQENMELFGSYFEEQEAEATRMKWFNSNQFNPEAMANAEVRELVNFKKSRRKKFPTTQRSFEIAVRLRLGVISHYIISRPVTIREISGWKHQRDPSSWETSSSTAMHRPGVDGEEVYVWTYSLILRTMFILTESQKKYWHS